MSCMSCCRSASKPIEQAAAVAVDAAVDALAQATAVVAATAITEVAETSSEAKVKKGCCGRVSKVSVPASVPSNEHILKTNGHFLGSSIPSFNAMLDAAKRYDSLWARNQYFAIISHADDEKNITTKTVRLNKENWSAIIADKDAHDHIDIYVLNTNKFKLSDSSVKVDGTPFEVNTGSSKDTIVLTGQPGEGVVESKP
jgi:hypothetical protein